MKKMGANKHHTKYIVAILATILMVPYMFGTYDINMQASSSITAYAEDDIPNNQSYDSQNTVIADPNKPEKPDANSVFGDARVVPDSTGYSSDIGNLLQKITSFIVSACNYIFIFGLIIHFAIESVMLAFPVMATVMSTKVPVQLYSHECAKVCGVTHSYGSDGKSSGGGVGSGGNSGSGKDGDKGFLSKFMGYAKERMITLILAGLLLVLCATNVMPLLINTAINWIIGLFIK